MLELLDPVIKSHHTEISNGLNVHYLEANLNKPKNPTALLLQGFPELSFSWRKIIPELAKKGFRVIAPDMRGYGLTTGGKKEFNTDISDISHKSLFVSELTFAPMRGNYVGSGQIEAGKLIS